MTQVCQVLLVLQDKLGNNKDHLRLRFREETRVTPDLQVHEVIQDIQEPLAHQVDRKERKENQEKQENEENQAKMATLVLQDFLDPREKEAFLVHQAEMEKEG